MLIIHVTHTYGSVTCSRILVLPTEYCDVEIPGRIAHKAINDVSVQCKPPFNRNMYEMPKEQSELSRAFQKTEERPRGRKALDYCS